MWLYTKDQCKEVTIGRFVENKIANSIHLMTKQSKSSKAISIRMLILYSTKEFNDMMMLS